MTTVMVNSDVHSVESWIDSYFESFTKADAETGRSEALELKRTNFPKALYRYRSLERLAYRLEELRDGYVFVSNPAEFNDPYDSALSTSFERVQNKVLEKYGLESYANIESKLFESFDEAAKKELEVHENDQQAAFHSLLGGLMSLLYGVNTSSDQLDIFGVLRQLVRVGCFSANPNSVLMWSHYANRHRGICVEFSGSSMLSSEKFLELVHPVQYTDKLFDLVQIFSTVIPDVGLNEVSQTSVPGINPDCWLILAACQKSIEWEYEQEWRLVSLDPAGRKGPRFSLDACGIKPSRIILGARIDGADQAAVRELAERISVSVVKARLARDRFQIEF